MEGKGWHHAYLGMLLFGVGFVMLISLKLPWVGVFLASVGLILMIDDLIQHTIQIKRPEYRSPLNRLYASIGWPAWVVKLNAWIDGVFGK
jgi:hypothetical protein